MAVPVDGRRERPAAALVSRILPRISSTWLFRAVSDTLSSSTTGLPKLIPRTHNDYVCNCLSSGRVAGIDAQTVFLAVLPLAHNYTLASPGMLATLEDENSA